MLRKTPAPYLAFIFAVMLIISCGRDKKNDKSGLQNETSFIEVSISGMTCTGCEQKIQTNVSRLKGIKAVKASHTEAKALIEYSPGLVDTVKIKDVITETGYTVKKIKSTLQE